MSFRITFSQPRPEQKTVTTQAKAIIKSVWGSKLLNRSDVPNLVYGKLAAACTENYFSYTEVGKGKPEYYLSSKPFDLRDLAKMNHDSMRINQLWELAPPVEWIEMENPIEAPKFGPGVTPEQVRCKSASLALMTHLAYRIQQLKMQDLDLPLSGAQDLGVTRLDVYEQFKGKYSERARKVVSTSDRSPNISAAPKPDDGIENHSAEDSIWKILYELWRVRQSLDPVDVGNGLFNDMLDLGPAAYAGIVASEHGYQGTCPDIEEILLEEKYLMGVMASYHHLMTSNGIWAGDTEQYRAGISADEFAKQIGNTQVGQKFDKLLEARRDLAINYLPMTLAALCGIADSMVREFNKNDRVLLRQLEVLVEERGGTVSVVPREISGEKGITVDITGCDDIINGSRQMSAAAAIFHGTNSESGRAQVSSSSGAVGPLR